MSKKVTKNDLVNEIYTKVNIDKKEISAIADAFLSEIKKALIDESTIELRGFGTFEVCVRKREKSRNPKTGTYVQLTPHYVAKFRPGQDLKKSLMEKQVSPDNEE